MWKFNINYQLPSKSKQAGFTLIEVLVVLVILGILMGLIGSNYITSRMRARDSQRKSDLRSVGQALDIYYNDHGHYPPHEQVVADNRFRIRNLTWGESAFYDVENPSKDTIYMQILPSDPSAPTTQYWYQTNTGGTMFQLCALLDNKEDGDIQEEDGYNGRICSEVDQTYFCNYCISSTNARVDLPLTSQ